MLCCCSFPYTYFSTFIHSLSGHWCTGRIFIYFLLLLIPKQTQWFVYDSRSLGNTQLRYLRVYLGWSATTAHQMGSWQWSVKNWDITKWVDLNIKIRSLQAALLTVIYFPIELLDIFWFWPCFPKETIPCSQSCLPQWHRNSLVNFNRNWQKGRGLEDVRLFHLSWKLKAWQRKATSPLTHWEKENRYAVWWEMTGQSACEYSWIVSKEGIKGITHEPEHVLLLT